MRNALPLIAACLLSSSSFAKDCTTEIMTHLSNLYNKQQQEEKSVLHSKITKFQVDSFETIEQGRDVYKISVETQTSRDAEEGYSQINSTPPWWGTGEIGYFHQIQVDSTDCKILGDQSHQTGGSYLKSLVD